jgi:hypothetical protein
MAYQRGSLKKVPRKEGDTWVLRYRVATADGRRVENTLPVSLVPDFPSENAAWREVDTLGLLVRVNSDAPAPQSHSLCHPCGAFPEGGLRRGRSTFEIRRNDRKHSADCPTPSHPPLGE